MERPFRRRFNPRFGRGRAREGSIHQSPRTPDSFSILGSPNDYNSSATFRLRHPLHDHRSLGSGEPGGPSTAQKLLLDVSAIPRSRLFGLRLLGLGLKLQFVPSQFSLNLERAALGRHNIQANRPDVMARERDNAGQELVGRIGGFS